jgi:hypothetical protein
LTKRKRTNNDLQNITHKTKDRVTDSDAEEGEVPSQPAETDYQNLVESEEEEDGM